MENLPSGGYALVRKALKLKIPCAWAGRNASSSLTSCEAVILVSNILSMDSILLLLLDRNLRLSTPGMVDKLSSW